MLGLSNRDYAVVLLEDIDLEAQLLAVKSLLRRNARAGQELSREIEELGKRAGEVTGEYGVHLENEWVDHLHDSVFQDAAHSMAALGMLAPLLESFLVATFAGIRDLAHPAIPVEPTGMRAAHRDDPVFWDPHYVFGLRTKRKDIAEGVLQLADSTGLGPHLPGDFAQVVDALFKYRNKMFHHGLEWPKEERAKFERLIVEKGWPSDWFSRSTTNGEPWIIYMSEVLITHSLKRLDDTLDGIGLFIQSRYPHLSADTAH
jgi:hypothetical protein